MSDKEWKGKTSKPRPYKPLTYAFNYDLIVWRSKNKPKEDKKK